MATGVVCNVVQLAQQPPPVPVLLDGMALPRPLPSKFSLAQRIARQRHGGFRWRHSAFQATQVKSWALDPEVEEELRESLVVMGPSNVVNSQRASRSLTAPPASLSSSLEGGEHEERQKNDIKTSPSSLSFKDLIPKSTEDVVTIFPVRAPIGAGKQVPGRFFSKPLLTEDQADQLGYFQYDKPPITSKSHSWVLPLKSDTRDDRTIDLSLGVTHQNHRQSPAFNQRVTRSQHDQANTHVQDSNPTFSKRVTRPHHNQFYTQVQDIVLRPLILTVRAKRNAGSRAKTYVNESQILDSNSNKRLKQPMSRLSRTAESKDSNFAVVLQGHRKYLHTKHLADMDQIDFIGGCGGEAAAPSDTLIEASPGKDETRPSKMDADTTGLSESTGFQGNVLAPLNSPTDQKDAFPELS